MTALNILLFIAVNAYLYFAFRNIRWVINRFYWALAVLALVLIPIWDVVLGKLYFNYLCENDAGIKIYKSAEADGVLCDCNIAACDIDAYKSCGYKYIEGINDDGNLELIQHLNIADGTQDLSVVKEPQSKYVFVFDEQSAPVIWLPIVKNRAFIKDRVSGELLAESIGYEFFDSLDGDFVGRIFVKTQKPIDSYDSNPYELLKQTLKIKKT